MRIAILSDGVHPYVLGGMQRHTFYLVKYLAASKINITLYHYNQSELDISLLSIFSDAEKEYIESIVLKFPEPGKLPGHYVRESYQYSTQIYELIKNRIDEFDYIYSKGFAGWRTIEEKKKQPLKFPPIGVKFHGYEMFQKQADYKSYFQSLILRGPVKWISRNADFVYSYGSKITEIIKRIGLQTSKIIEIPAGIEPDWLREESTIQVNQVRKFVYLGRYERRKGIEELNAAIKSMLEKKENFEFHFIGPFEDAMKLQSNQLIYHGVIRDNLKLQEILDECDVLVCPSWSEGMPNVILEGMARGCAVIATNVGANSIMVDTENGRIIETGNSNDICLKMKEFIEADVDNIRQLRIASIHRVSQKFLYPIILDKFVGSVNQILKSNEKNKRV